MATPINHTEQMNDRLLTQYKSAFNMIAILGSFVDQVQELEDALQEFQIKRSLDTATGEQLNKIGILLNAPRTITDDDNYRSILYAKIAEYYSDGTINDLIDILLLISGCIDVSIEEIGRATIIITINQPASIFYLNEAVNAGKVAGVNVELIESFSEPFAFFEYTAKNNTPKGFDDIDNPGNGGILSNIL